jgi:hypothetical protein
LFERLRWKEIVQGNRINLYHLDGIDLLPAKFRTSNGRCRCHIQRLC